MKNKQIKKLKGHIWTNGSDVEMVTFEVKDFKEIIDSHKVGKGNK